MLLAFAALFFQDRDAFFKDLSKYNNKSSELNRDQRRVGSVLRMVSGYTGDHIKAYGSDLLGEGSRHGDGLYNAQWAAATAEYLEQMYGDIFEAFVISEKPDINEIRIKLYQEPYIKRTDPKFFKVIDSPI